MNKKVSLKELVDFAEGLQVVFQVSPLGKVILKGGV